MENETIRLAKKAFDKLGIEIDDFLIKCVYKEGMEPFVLIGKLTGLSDDEIMKRISS